LKAHSIRLRLTAWYFLSLAAILALFALGCQFALRTSINHAVDEEIRAQMDAISKFLTGEAHTLAPDQIKDELNEMSSSGGFLRVEDENGHVVYESEFLTRHKLLANPKQPSGGPVTFSTGPYRIGSRRVRSGTGSYSITVVHSLREFGKSIERFQTILILLSALALSAACAGGVWLSRRALAPVDEITDAAQNVTFTNLSARLKVPDTNDELQRLTETLNTMLDRIEKPVRQMHQFTADASHELRAPLTLIRTAAEFSLRRERSHQELIDSLSTILRESERTSSLVDNLLLLSRADSGIDQLTLAPLALSEPVRDAIHEAKPLAVDKHVHLESQIPETPIVIAGHHDLLRRAVFILIDNALKYTPEGGKVCVTLSQTKSAATLTVEDTGIGITADQLPHVFDRFWRADQVRSRNQGGVGLGLAIAQTVVSRHNGSVAATSNEKGSRFSIVLPLSKEAISEGA
jgi:two-component system, OmpR family, heavy metal sensor histidine kinase CusS